MACSAALSKDDHRSNGDAATTLRMHMEQSKQYFCSLSWIKLLCFSLTVEVRECAADEKAIAILPYTINPSLAMLT